MGKKTEEALAAQYPLCPLDAPWLSRPGADFDRMARALIGEYTPRVVKGLKGEEKAEAVAENQSVAAVYAKRYNDAIARIYRDVLYTENCQISVDVKGRLVPATILSGTYRSYKDENGDWLRIPGIGPCRAKVMIVGGNPHQDEVLNGENFTGKGNEALGRALEELGLDGPEIAEWYWTTAVKHPHVDPSKKGFVAAQQNNMLPLLQMELRLVRPDFILCMGAEAARAVLGSKASIDRLFGRVSELDIPCHGIGEKPDIHKAKVVAILAPGKVAASPETYGDLVIGLRSFRDLTRGVRVGELETGLHHVNIYTEKHLASVVDSIIAASNGTDVIAVDAEWHGDRPKEPGSYLRTIQFCAKPKEAYVVVLRREGGADIFKPGPQAAIAHLRRLLRSTPERRVRVGGHYLTADSPWLADFGVDVAKEYAVAPSPSRTRTEGGFDTYKMTHAVREQVEGGFKLENLLARFCGIPRYDSRLQAWKDDYCRTYGLKDKELGGYGMCPSDVLHSPFPAVWPNYAAYDVDGVRRYFDELNGSWGVEGVKNRPGMLDADENGNECRTAFWHSHAATPAALEMEATGILVDRTRGDVVTDRFIETYDKLLDAFQKRVNWVDVRMPVLDKKGNRKYKPDGTPATRLVSKGFNPASTEQCRELLFGYQLNGAIDKVAGGCRRLSPPSVESLNLTPVLASGDRPEPWERIVARDEVGTFWPSTNRESLGILSGTEGAPGKICRALRDLRFLAQALKGTLRRPWADADGKVVIEHNEEDDKEVDGAPRIYDGGLMFHMHRDRRVRTHFGLVETGRWSSWGPNLQNISKRREDDYKRMLGTWDYNKKEQVWEPKGDYIKELGVPRYPFAIRSMLKAAPGTVLIEVDYKMAEMAIIGWAANDMTMLEHVRRNSLKENDPDFLDVHSQTAINAFQLDTPANRAKAAAEGVAWGATKDLLKAIKAGALRTAAKNVIYGVPYGRSNTAIARQCLEEGAYVSDEDAQKLIDTYKKVSYPQVAAYLERCSARVVDPGWMATPYLRYRRFPPTSDPKILAEMQRAACNFGIQSGVAEMINLACRELMLLRDDQGVWGSDDRWFDFALQIHDALLFQVPIPAISWFCDEIVVEGMSRRVPYYPADLDGKRLDGLGPYNLAVDVELYQYWGETMDRDWAIANGIPAEHVPKAVPKPPAHLILPSRN
jgi:uracil-DNA glycosylase family 4